MIRNSEGVAGFFEDLPVLIFVLVGVSVLVMSAAWVSRQNVERELEMGLDDEAFRVAEAVLESFRSDWGAVPRITSIQAKNLSSINGVASGCDGYAVTVSQLYPGLSVLATDAAGNPGDSCRTGYGSILFNGVDDHGLIQILEVKVIVWQNR